MSIYRYLLASVVALALPVVTQASDSIQVYVQGKTKRVHSTERHHHREHRHHTHAETRPGLKSNLWRYRAAQERPPKKRDHGHVHRYDRHADNGRGNIHYYTPPRWRYHDRYYSGRHRDGGSHYYYRSHDSRHGHHRYHDHRQCNDRRHNHRHQNHHRHSNHHNGGVSLRLNLPLIVW